MKVDLELSIPRFGALAALSLLFVMGLGGCAKSAQMRSGLVQVVGAENFYADVAAKIGGPYVEVTSILNNPNIDPHTYESNTSAASAVANAALVVQNGLGYDAFMDNLEAASPSSTRRVITVGKTLGYRVGDNPHIWYDPATMPKVAAMIGDALAHIDPAHAATFRTNQRIFDASLQPWTAAIAQLKRTQSGTPIAVTEPVFNYTADAIGLKIETPRAFQLAIEEGNDPAPQDVAAEQQLLTSHAVKMLVYNQQTIEPITTHVLAVARAAHVPVVGVYETMPAGMSYAQWMATEVRAVIAALRHGVSTERLH